MPADRIFLYDDDLEQFFDDHFKKSLFRLEVLDFYEPDNEEFQRYLRGDSGPNMERKQAWLDYIATEVNAGHPMRRVHIVRSPLNEYLQFACEWGYTHNAQAGEQIRILDLANKPANEAIVFEDFWIIDDKIVLVMHYDDNGVFVKGEVLPEEEASRYYLAQDAAWADGEPFSQYWENHPQNRKAPQHT